MKTANDLVAIALLSQSDDGASLSIFQNRKFQQRYFWRRYGIWVVRVWQKQVMINQTTLQTE